MQLSLGFSPCPNDTFIFDAMIHGKIDTEGLSFDIHLADVEALNQWAFEDKLDITKLSYHAFAFASKTYALLRSGSALGNNCGPLLIAREHISLSELPNKTIGIPGKYTTANFLCCLAFPEATNKKELLFSEIESALLDKRIDVGLIIHENRFTYADKGLVKLQDLGEFWETTTQLPIPLGGIVTKRSLPKAIQQKIERVLARSVQFALDHPEESQAYVAAHAQEMNPEVMRQHISLYVNDYTVNLGERGTKAVHKLFDLAEKSGLVKLEEELFV